MITIGKSVCRGRFGVVRQRVNEYLLKDPSKTINDFGSRELLTLWTLWIMPR